MLDLGPPLRGMRFEEGYHLKGQGLSKVHLSFFYFYFILTSLSSLTFFISENQFFLSCVAEHIQVEEYSVDDKLN